MEHKKDLAKIALAALVLASVNPVVAHIDDHSEACGTFLAAGCAAHGCKSIADNSERSDVYSTRNNSYQMSNPTSRSGNESSSTSSQEDNDSQESDDDMETTTKPLTEAQLLSMLNPQTREIYQSLDPKGKALAILLASQDFYKDKNLAVKEAQRRMNERRDSNR